MSEEERIRMIIDGFDERLTRIEDEREQAKITWKWLNPRKSFIEAWEENIDKEITDQINRDVGKMVCDHNWMLIQTPAGNPFEDKYICSKCYVKCTHVKYPNIKQEGKRDE